MPDLTADSGESSLNVITTFFYFLSRKAVLRAYEAATLFLEIKALCLIYSTA